MYMYMNLIKFIPGLIALCLSLARLVKAESLTLAGWGWSPAVWTVSTDNTIRVESNEYLVEP